MNKENKIQRFDKMQQQAPREPASIILLNRLELSGRRGLMHW